MATGLGMAVVCLSGCGGFSASHTISPASFFLPGVKWVPPQPATNPLAGSETIVKPAVCDLAKAQ
jgi:hypothetical protein